MEQLLWLFIGIVILVLFLNKSLTKSVNNYVKAVLQSNHYVVVSFLLFLVFVCMNRRNIEGYSQNKAKSSRHKKHITANKKKERERLKRIRKDKTIQAKKKEINKERGRRVIRADNNVKA
jgi:high-affinity K+ transport system ATPase subunit B